VVADALVLVRRVLEVLGVLGVLELLELLEPPESLLWDAAALDSVPLDSVPLDSVALASPFGSLDAVLVSRLSVR